jgi:hypothetical protein
MMTRSACSPDVNVSTSRSSVCKVLLVSLLFIFCLLPASAGALLPGLPVASAYTCKNPYFQSGGVVTTLEAINAGTYTPALDKCGDCPARTAHGKQPCELLEVRNVKVIQAAFINKDGDWRLYLTDGTMAKGALYSFRIEIPTAYQRLFLWIYGCKYPSVGASITLDDYPYLDTGKEHGNPLSHWELHPLT